MAADIRESANAALPTDLSQAPAALIRKELELVLADMAQRGRQVGVGAGLLGGAGVLGVGAFAALTSALIAALERRPARGAFLMAAIYGAGAGTLTEAGLNRVRHSLQGSEGPGGDGEAATSGATETGGNARKRTGSAAKGAKSSAKSVKRKAPAKAATAGRSSAKAVKRRSSAKPARSS